MHIRFSGWDRPLVNEHHRIKELYKLPDAEVLRAMVGVDSTVSVWRAPALEASQYPAIMRAEGVVVSPLMVQQAYGYNAVAKLMADTPQAMALVQGTRQVDLPPGLQNDSTIYEYSAAGRLLGFYNHNQGQTHIARSPLCVMIEGIVGIGSTALTTLYAAPTQTLDVRRNYRFYKTPIHLGAPLNAWVDVTDTADYSVVGNQVTWHVDPEYWYTAVKNDLNFLSYNFLLAPDNGVLRFSLTAKELRGGVPYTQVLQIPVGRVDLWLNGYPLIANLDYYLHGAQVVIVNKEYWVEGKQSVTVRGTGFCNADLSMTPPAESGWVENGLLSHDGRFEVRDDRIIRIVVRGGLRKRQDLTFAEDANGVIAAGAVNGDPYVIEDVIVPIQGLTGIDTYGYRAVSLAVDQEINDYLSLHLPEPTLTDPNIIPELYQVYSPFSSKLMHDMVAGVLAPVGYDGHYNETDLQRWLAPYLWLLPFDPCVQGVDSRYVSVHPHELYVETQLSFYQYALLERAVAFYLNNKVDLTRFISIKEGWL